MIAKQLIQWYHDQKRDLPFRKTNDPYKIWVSEIMAQQTRIDTMIPYYSRWIEKFPTIQACAQADIQEILKAWEGLGYYRRARYLHSGCKYIIEKHNGIFPHEFEDIQKIPGVGPYTSAAIASIAFGQSTPAVDGNVFRVVTRLQKINDDITKSSTKQRVTSLCEEWMAGVDASSFTQGMMELGAMICTPTSPSCLTCPLNQMCLSFKDQTMLDFPVKKAKKKPSLHHYDLYIVTKGNQLLVSYDDSDGLMEGLARLPMAESDEYDHFPRNKIGQFKHIYSHKIWYCTVYTTTSTDYPFSSLKDSWVLWDDVMSIAWITAAKKALSYQKRPE